MSDDMWRRGSGGGADDDEFDDFGELRFSDEETDDEAPLTFGSDDTGPLPHWTASPTGEMPRLFPATKTSTSGVRIRVRRPVRCPTTSRGRPLAPPSPAAGDPACASVSRPEAPVATRARAPVATRAPANPVAPTTPPREQRPDPRRAKPTPVGGSTTPRVAVRGPARPAAPNPDRRARRVRRPVWVVATCPPRWPSAC